MSFTIDFQQFRCAYQLAAENLKQQKDMLNHLNIFPVADKDTGINMARSMERTAANLISTGTPAQVAEDAYMQLLEYSCGNSGTILALFFEGFAYGLPTDAETVSGSQLAHAYLRGAENAVNGVRDPMAGTMLTVAMQSAQAGISLTEVTDSAAQIFYRITEEAHAALMQTAQQNPVLRPYGVVDSGAYGFCLILDAFLHSFAPELNPVPYGTLHLPDTPSEESKTILFRYCTELVLIPSADTDFALLDSCLRALGDCYLRAGSDFMTKIHLHTNQPEEVISIVSGYGSIRSQKVDDMSAV